MASLTRKKRILDFVRKEESLTVDELVNRLDVSPATIRRDLVWLEGEGKVVRLHGAVMDRKRVADEPSFLVKQERFPKGKRKIGQLVADQIPSGATVFIDAGTTCFEAGVSLLTRGDVRIFTNSLPLMYHSASTGLKVTSIGGEVRGLTGAVVGTMALDWIRHLNFDYGVVGASAINLETGVMTTELSEAGVKRSIIETSHISILAADSAKVGERATVQFADWEAFQIWVTDKVFDRDSAVKMPKNLSVLECE